MDHDPAAAAPPRRRRLGWPEPLTWGMLAVLAWNAVELWLALTDRFEHDVGNDAAGAGMSRGFTQVFVTIGAGAAVVLALLFLLIRHRGVRTVLLVLLIVEALVLPTIF